MGSLSSIFCPCITAERPSSEDNSPASGQGSVSDRSRVEHRQPRPASAMLDGIANIDSTNGGLTDAVGGTEKKAKFRTATATVIASKNDRPGEVLVAESSKHGDKCVFPGGKLSLDDLASEEPVIACVRHEMDEEVGQPILHATIIGAATDSTRDVRLTEIGKFAMKRDNLVPDKSIPEAQLKKIGYGDPESKEKVYVSFGNPDTIVIGTIPYPEVLVDTSELKNPRFINLRGKKDFSEFGAGHDVLAAAYAEKLPIIDQLFSHMYKDPLPEEFGVATLLDDDLRDFAATRRRLLDQ